MTRAHVVVVGGGIAGLSTAWTLTNADPTLHVTVLEQASRFGGKVQSSPFAGAVVDTGPDAFLAVLPAARELCEQLGLRDELVAPVSSKAWIWSRSRLRNFPLGTVLGVPSNVFELTNVISPRGILRAGLDLVLPKRVGRSSSDASIGSLIRARLGNEIADRLIDPLIGGINAGTIDSLSLQSTAPQVAALADTHRSLIWAAQIKTPKEAKKAPKKSVFLATPNGMHTLVETLVERLRDNGVELRWNQRVDALTRRENGSWAVSTQNETIDADHVVVALPASASAALVRSISTQAATLLDSIRCASVAMVRMAYKRDDVAHNLDGTGFVVPAVDRTVMTACSWASSKWDRISHSPHAVFRVSAGRITDDRSSSMTDEQLVATLHAELDAAIGLSGQPVEFDVTRWTNAFPQYEPGHAARIAQARTFLEGSGVELAGAAFDGVGIPACIASGKRAAERLIEGRKSSEPL